MQPLAIRPPSPASPAKTVTAGQPLHWNPERVLKNEDAEEVTKGHDCAISPFFWYELPVLNLKPCNAYDFVFYYDQSFWCCCFFGFVFIVHCYVEQILLWKSLNKRKKNVNIFLCKIENLHLDGIVMWPRKRIWRWSMNTDKHQTCRVGGTKRQSSIDKQSVTMSYCCLDIAMQ